MDTLYGIARFSEKLVGTGIKFVRDFQQDPRTATLTGIGKLAETVRELSPRKTCGAANGDLLLWAV